MGGIRATNSSLTSGRGSKSTVIGILYMFYPSPARAGSSASRCRARIDA